MTQLHVGRRYFITGAEPSQTQPEQIYDEDCGAGWREGEWERVGERRDTQICLIDTIKRGKEVSVTQWRMMKPRASDHVWRPYSLVSPCENWAAQPRGYNTKYWADWDWCRWWPYQAENVPAPRTKHHLMRRENLKSESSVLWHQTVCLLVSSVCWHLLWTIKIFSHKLVWMHNVRVTHNDPNSNFIKCWPWSVSVSALTSSLVSIVSSKTRAVRRGDNVALQFHQGDTIRDTIFGEPLQSAKSFLIVSENNRSSLINHGVFIPNFLGF